MTTTDPAGVASPRAAVNPYLQGPFAPVTEEVTVTDLPVTGTVPGWLDGRYLRIGPNPVRPPDPATYHWFTGDGMVHGIRLRGGRAEWYRNRWARSPAVAAALGEAHARGGDGRDGDVAPNTNVIGHAGRTLALVEGGPRPYELTDELDTVGPHDFGGTLAGAFTAHPHRDPATGELHAVTYPSGGGDRVRYSVVGVDGRIRRTVEVPVPGAPMMHDFALTRDHVVLLDLPVTPEGARAPGRAVRPAGAGSLPYSWDPGRPARVGVLPREATGLDARWFEVGPCFVFHVLNAYEERSRPAAPVDRVVVDVVRYPTMFASSRQGPDAVSTLDRWTIDLAAGTVGERCLDDTVQEFPRVDERVTGLRHRYGYTVGALPAAVLKHDLVAGTTASHAFGLGDIAGEFAFVPAGPGGGEDDGVLMGLVQRAATGRAELVLLDAATLGPVATVHLPARVPYGFHGNWLPHTPTTPPRAAAAAAVRAGA